MSLLDVANVSMTLLGLGSAATLAQGDPTSGVWSSLLQLGAVGAILLWITFVDIPNRNKAHEIAIKAWQDALTAERASSKEERTASDLRHAATLKAHAETLDRFITATARMAAALDGLTVVERHPEDKA